MANWYGTSRSNYFRVKDDAAFKAWVESAPDSIRASAGDAQDGQGDMWAIFSETEYGDWPSTRYDEEKDDEIEWDIMAELAPHLADGEVAVLMSIGAEKERYVTGWAGAVNSEGKQVGVNLNDVYALAAKEFGVVESKITRAQY